MTTMPVITIRQPWAHAILHFWKNVENRSWPTKHRGPILVHAGRAFVNKTIRADIDAARLATMLSRPVDNLLPDAVTPDELKALTGGIVGVVTIVDCVQNHPSPWAIPGHWHWVLADPKPIPFQACKGRLGIWRIETPERVVV